MKHLQAILFLLLLAPATNTYAQVQTLVNQLWLDTTGHPVQNSYFQTARRDGSYVYVAGSSYHQGQSANVLITKYSTTGTKIWQKEYNTTSDNADLVTDMYVKGNYYYATGTMWDSVNSRSNIFILKGSIATGDTVWLRIYSGSYSGYHAGASILPDNNGNVYVGGAEQASSSNFRMLAIKYDSAGTQLWASTYDSAGYYDAIVSMGIDAAKNYLTITGISGSGFANWDFVTTAFNLTTGVRHHVVSRSSNGNGSFSQPVGIGKDYSDNTFIAGTSAINAYNTDIKIIKYDTLFNEVWVRRWGKSDSLKDEATAFAQDVNANLLLTGYTTGAGGAKSMLVLKYSTGGTLLWSRTVAAPNPANNCIGKDIVADDSSNVYVTGSVNNGLNNDIITVCYDKNGKLIWQQIYNSDENTIDDGYDVLVDNQHKVYVSGRSALASPRFVTICYDYLQLSNQAYLDTNDIPVYLKNQLIIKFNKNAIKSSAVNKKGLNFGNLDAFLESWAVDSLMDNLPYDQKYYKLGRIFYGLRTSDTISISRLGERIPIPDFWSTFLLIFTAPISEKKLCDTLSKVFPFIEYAELDILGSLSNSANDPFYTQQYGLLPPMVYDTVLYPNAGIDVEAAWEYTTGKPHIKLGVFDEGISWTHRDLLLDSNDINTTVVKGGVDLWGYPILSSSFPITGPHGTICAGLIAARSNNGYGIAGVAGGNGLNNTGCSLYSYVIWNPDVSAITVSRFAAELVHASTQTQDTSYGFGLHGINHSYKFAKEFNAANYNVDSNKSIWRNAIRFSFRNKVVNCFSSGNESSEILPPPMQLDDDWLLVVSGTGWDGTFKAFDDEQNPGWFPNYGTNVDIAALCAEQMIPTTWPSPNNPFGRGGIDDFTGGTSAAAPLATGVAGLLMSYLNDTISMYKNLSPEDIEYIIQRSAFNIDDPGYDVYTGYGRLNAGGALSIIDTSKRKLLHLESDSITGSSISLQKVDSNLILKLNEVEKTSLGVLLNTIDYKFDVYKVTCNIPHNLSNTDTLVGIWPRSSSSFVYHAPSFDDNYLDSILMPREHVYLQSANSQNAIFYGYTYCVKDKNTDSIIGWLPMDTTQAKTTNFSYSILVGDSIHAPWDSIISDIIVVHRANYSLRVYPSPANYNQTIEITGHEFDHNITLKLFSIYGHLVNNIFDGKLDAEKRKFNVDLSSYQSGMYVYILENENGEKFSIKTIKY
jgi:hypothetical protein